MEDLRSEKLKKVHDVLISTGTLIGKLKVAAIVLCSSAAISIALSGLPGAAIADTLGKILLVLGLLLASFLWGLWYLVRRILKEVKKVQDKAEGKND